ncbi:MAG: GNAT family N-acetyltransferase [Acidimicrobiia bacterium]|nr:GNAT family N-acetyltransferase [Acidimicrobiia bacterium]
MPEPTVRTLTAEEVPAGVRLIGRAMLTDARDEVQDAWGAEFEPERTHGAFDEHGTLGGVVRWFHGDLSVPGGVLPAGLVGPVAVAATHRRRGYLRKLVEAQLTAIAAEERPIATLISAEWPIYGRYGYGPSVEACTWRVDALSAEFIAPPTGAIELVTPDQLRPHLEAAHDLRGARTPGAVTRLPAVWDRLAGTVPDPGSTDPPGLRRGVVWRDHHGTVLGAAAYKVRDAWIDNRPRGTIEVTLLVGATPEAERELWRHLCETDWISTVVAVDRGVDDPLPYFLVDGRAAVARDRFDVIWSRILDVPSTFGAYRTADERRAVVEVVDGLGFTTGRWRIELGPDGSQAVPTTDSADVRLPISALGALHLGGPSVGRLHEAGWIDEDSPGGVGRLSSLLATPIAPWSPTTY